MTKSNAPLQDKFRCEEVQWNTDQVQRPSFRQFRCGEVQRNNDQVQRSSSRQVSLWRGSTEQ